MNDLQKSEFVLNDWCTEMQTNKQTKSCYVHACVIIWQVAR
jgi:hypothetical protein